MDFKYILPPDYRINFGPLQTLIERAERVRTMPNLDLFLELLKTGHIQHPDKKKVAIIRGTGCERGHRTSALWLAMNEFLNGLILHDIDHGGSVGATEQMQLRNEALGIKMYEALARGFIHLDRREQIFLALNAVRHE